MTAWIGIGAGRRDFQSVLTRGTTPASCEVRRDRVPVAPLTRRAQTGGDAGAIGPPPSRGHADGLGRCLEWVVVAVGDRGLPQDVISRHESGRGRPNFL